MRLFNRAETPRADDSIGTALSREKTAQSLQDFLINQLAYETGLSAGEISSINLTSINRELSKLSPTDLKRLRLLLDKAAGLGQKIRDAEGHLAKNDKLVNARKLALLHPYAKDVANPWVFLTKPIRNKFDSSVRGKVGLDRLHSESGSVLHPVALKDVFGLNVEIGNSVKSEMVERYGFELSAEKLYKDLLNERYAAGGVGDVKVLERYKQDFEDAQAEIFATLKSAQGLYLAVSKKAKEEIQNKLSSGKVGAVEAGELSLRSRKLVKSSVKSGKKKLVDLGSREIKKADEELRDKLSDVIDREVVEIIVSAVVLPQEQREMKVLEELRTKVLFNPYFDGPEDAAAFLYKTLVGLRKSGASLTLKKEGAGSDETTEIKQVKIWDADGNKFLNKLLSQLGDISRKVSGKYDYEEPSASVIDSGVQNVQLRIDQGQAEKKKKEAEEKARLEEEERKKREAEAATRQSAAGNFGPSQNQGQLDVNLRWADSGVEKRTVEKKEVEKNELHKLLAAARAGKESKMSALCQGLVSDVEKGLIESSEWKDFLDDVEDKDLQDLGRFLFNLSEKLKSDSEKEKDREAVRFVLGKIVDYRPSLFDFGRREITEKKAVVNEGKTQSVGADKTKTKRLEKTDVEKFGEEFEHFKYLLGELKELLSESDFAEAFALQTLKELAKQSRRLQDLVGNHESIDGAMPDWLAVRQKITGIVGIGRWIGDVDKLFLQNPKRQLSNESPLEEFPERERDVRQIVDDLLGQLNEYAIFDDSIDSGLYEQILQSCKSVAISDGGLAILKEFAEDEKADEKVTRCVLVLGSILDKLKKSNGVNNEYRNSVGLILEALVPKSELASQEKNDKKKFEKIQGMIANREGLLEVASGLDEAALRKNAFLETLRGALYEEGLLMIIHSEENGIFQKGLLDYLERYDWTDEQKQLLIGISERAKKIIVLPDVRLLVELGKRLAKKKGSIPPPPPPPPPPSEITREFHRQFINPGYEETELSGIKSKEQIRAEYEKLREIQQVSPGPEADKSFSICGKCGAVNDGNAKYCRQCGDELDTQGNGIEKKHEVVVGNYSEAPIFSSFGQSQDKNFSSKVVSRLQGSPTLNKALEYGVRGVNFKSILDWAREKRATAQGWRFLKKKDIEEKRLPEWLVSVRDYSRKVYGDAAKLKNSYERLDPNNPQEKIGWKNKLRDFLQSDRVKALYGFASPQRLIGEGNDEYKSYFESFGKIYSERDRLLGLITGLEGHEDFPKIKKELDDFIDLLDNLLVDSPVKSE